MARYGAEALHGNFVIFPVVAGIAAMRGSRLAGVLFLAMAMLLPRPLFVPLVAWLLWRRPDLRLPFVLMAAVSVTFTVASGQAEAWLTSALTLSADYRWREWDIGPTRLLGPWWLLAGIPLAGWLTRKGWVGIAGLAISPYVGPIYLLVLLLDVARLRHRLEEVPRHRHGFAKPQARLRDKQGPRVTWLDPGLGSTIDASRRHPRLEPSRETAE